MAAGSKRSITKFVFLNPFIMTPHGNNDSSSLPEEEEETLETSQWC